MSATSVRPARVVADLRLAVASRPCSPKKKDCGNEPDLAKGKD